MRIVARASIFAAVSIALASSCAPAKAQMRGHGGPVRALAISTDGATLLSGSFDSSAIRWSLARGAAEQVLRLHDSAVNAVAILADGRDVTAGEDGRIAIWTPGRQKPDAILEQHAGPIAALAVSPDGKMLASASWDRTVRLWPLGSGVPRTLEGHTQNVNGVAFLPDNSALVSAGYDATLRIWPLQVSESPTVVTLPAPLNAVVVAPDGEIVAAGADGKLYFRSARGEERGEFAALPNSIVALALSHDGERIAAAGIRDAVVIIDRKTRSTIARLTGPALPAWSIAFLPDGHTLLTGGSDHIIHRWDPVSGALLDSNSTGADDDPIGTFGDDPGARVFRACVACHTLKSDQGNRAGPTLHHIFGRRIATLPGYNFSEALTHLDIVWTPETVAKLFEIGPARYTPGTKMPDQRLGAEDRAALIAFLEKATE